MINESIIISYGVIKIFNFVFFVIILVPTTGDKIMVYIKKNLSNSYKHSMSLDTLVCIIFANEFGIGIKSFRR